MNRRRIILGFTLIALVFGFRPLAGAQPAGEELLFQTTFDDEARGWELEPGWGVVAEGDNRVLAGAGHSWARPDAAFPGDFRLQFQLELLQGAVHLVYRLNDAGRYFIGFHPEGSSLHKQYWPDTFLELAQTGATHNLDQWYQIEIVGEGGQIRLLVDGQLELEYTDPEPLLGGSFAFETQQDGAAYVDEIAVWGPPAEVATPTEPAPAPAGGLSWVRTGGPLGGLGYDVRMRPDNPDTLYVTDAWAGVHISTDGGQTWFPSNSGITARAGELGDAIPVFCLTIDPHNYDTIWVGTQNVRGLFKSTDGGRSWVEKDNGVTEREGITFRGITVDPRSPDIVYAAAELSSWVWAGEERSGREFDMTAGVVFKTSDGGENWTAIWRGQNLARYVWIDPRDSNVVYVSTGIFDREAANSDPQGRIPGGEGVLKSTDGGRSWSNANNGLNNLYVGSLFMHPEDPDVLLAGTGNNQYYDEMGVYLSTDGGASWQHVLRDENINAVEFTLADPRIAYAGSAAAIYRSADGGQTWQRVSGGQDGWGPPGVRAGFPIDLQVDPRDPDRLFANEYGGGNLLSTDGGRTWSVASSGYTGAQVRDLAVDPVSGRVLAAARSGLFASPDGGATWLGLNAPPAFSMEWNVVALDPAEPSHILASNNWNSTLLESRDASTSWQQVSQPAGHNMGWLAIAFAPSDPQIVYAGTSAFFSAGSMDNRMPAAGVYVSHNGGASWQEANDAASQDANVAALLVDPHNAQLAFAATGNHGLLKTTNGGTNWSAVNQGLPDNPSVLSVAMHPAEPEVVFAGLAFGGLYRSADGGASWQPSAAGLPPEAFVSDILFVPADPQVIFIADRMSGVYRSEDGGASWQPLSSGLRTRTVNALAITADGRHLYAGTEGEGVFRLDLAGEPPPIPALMPAAAPAASATPRPTQPTAIPSPQPVNETPEPEPTAAPTARSGGPCGGAIILPLALIPLTALGRRRR